MPRPRRDQARALRRRFQTLFTAGPDDGSSSWAPHEDPAPSPEAIVAWATRDLLRAESSEEVARIVGRVVDQLGGRVVPATDGDPDALPLDLGFGVSEPILPTAPPGSPERRAIERHLPALVADARQVHDGILRTAHLSADVATDPVTGLQTRASFLRALARMRDDDAAVVVRITVPAPEPGDEDDLSRAVRAFASWLRGQLTDGDHAAQLEEDEFGVLLHRPGAAGTAVVAARLERGWQHAHPDVEVDLGVASFHDSGTATLRAAYTALDDALLAAEATAPAEDPVVTDAAERAVDAPAAPDADDATERSAP